MLEADRRPSLPCVPLNLSIDSHRQDARRLGLRENGAAPSGHAPERNAEDGARCDSTPWEHGAARLGLERGLRGRALAGPAAASGLRRPEVDGVGRAADLQFLPQCFRRRGKPAPDRLGRLAVSGLQLPRLSGGYALDVPHVFLQQRRALSGCAVRARLVLAEECQTWACRLPPGTSGRIGAAAL